MECRIEKTDKFKIYSNKIIDSELAVKEIYSDKEDEGKNSPIPLLEIETKKRGLYRMREKHSSSFYVPPKGNSKLKMQGKSDLKKHDAGGKTSSTYTIIL